MVLPVIVAGARVAASRFAARAAAAKAREYGASLATQEIAKSLGEKSVNAGLSKIVGLATKKEPGEIETDNAARKKSLETDKKPGPELEPGAKANVGPGLADSIENQAQVKLQNKDNEVATTNANNLDQIDTENESIPPFNLPPNYDANKIQRIQSELSSKEKINLNFQETVELINSDFKVKFPWESILSLVGISLFEITMWLTGIFIAMAGLASALIPFVGVFTAVSAKVIGIGLSLGTYVLVAVLNGVVFWRKLQYTKNASDVVKKVSVLRRYFYKYFLRRFWLAFIGIVTPVVGRVFSFIDVIVTWRMIKKKVGRIEKIVR